MGIIGVVICGVDAASTTGTRPRARSVSTWRARPAGIGDGEGSLRGVTRKFWATVHLGFADDVSLAGSRRWSWCWWTA